MTSIEMPSSAAAIAASSAVCTRAPYVTSVTSVPDATTDATPIGFASARLASSSTSPFTW